jgi:hypothetical protein
MRGDHADQTNRVKNEFIGKEVETLEQRLLDANQTICWMAVLQRQLSGG